MLDQTINIQTKKLRSKADPYQEATTALVSVKLEDQIKDLELNRILNQKQEWCQTKAISIPLCIHNIAT